MRAADTPRVRPRSPRSCPRRDRTPAGSPLAAVLAHRKTVRGQIAEWHAAAAGWTFQDGTEDKPPSRVPLSDAPDSRSFLACRQIRCAAVPVRDTVGSRFLPAGAA